MNKYSKDAPVFSDPVLRCDSCNKITRLEYLHKLGRCENCGNQKVRNLQLFSDEEHKQMIEWEIDPEFMRLFQGVD